MGSMRLAAFLVPLALVVHSGILPSPARAQNQNGESAVLVKDALGRETPRGTVLGFLYAAQDGNWAAAVQFLELPRRETIAVNAETRELARMLKVLLDRGLRGLSGFSNVPEGNLQDGLPEDRELVGEIELRRRSLDVLLRRVTLPGSDHRVWLFSQETLRQVPAVYAATGPTRLETMLPAPLVQIQFWEVALWQWLALLILLPVSFALAWVVTRIVSRILHSLTRRTNTTIDDQLVTALFGPVLLILLILFFRSVTAALELPLLLRQFLSHLHVVAGLAAFVWFAFRAVDLGAEHTREALVKTQRISAISIIPLGRRIAKAVAITVGALAILENVGFDLGAIITGLGVGGIAIALAAQKTLENLFGGFAIITDQPVRVGDFCRFGDKVGTVEDIGMRSTRIRTLDRTVVSVPNAQFSTMALENFAPREKCRFVLKFGVRYETTPDQLRYVLAEVRRMLYEHPKVEAGARIRFVGFGASSLDMEVFSFVLTPDFGEFLSIQEDLLLRIMDIVNASGTGFAFPSRTTYLAKDSGLDTARSQAATDAVRVWRERGDLPFPDFRADDVAAMQNRLPYPMPESSVAQPSGNPSAS
jgi:MscS family membrane protein